MYLINTASLQIEHFPEADSVEYAILSHRWEHEEVSLQDMLDGRGAAAAAGKYGYRKIRRTCEQARREGLAWAWIDTCCIDKTSSAELSEAINSMFAWYRGARICYVYLADVGDDGDDDEGGGGGGDGDNNNKKDSKADRGANAKTIEHSVWFTRGWTLQELIAPRHITFFDAGWRQLGTKASLGACLSRATGVPIGVLSGKDNFMRCSVAQRMSWAARRTTTRREDRAYSLLGIFGINMPLLYGEGDRAFVRLQEEIIRQTDDHSIFAWHYRGSDGGDGGGDDDFASGLLAHSPEAFAGCSRIVRREPALQLSTFSTTNRGLAIRLPIIQWSYNFWVALLNCVSKEGRSVRESNTIGILLRPLVEPEQYARVILNGHDRILFNPVCFRNDVLVFGREPEKVNAIFQGKSKGPLIHNALASTKSSLLEEESMRAKDVYIRQNPLDFGSLRPKRLYGFWLRKFSPFQKASNFDPEKDFSIRSWNTWNFTDRLALIPEGCYGAALAVHVRGKMVEKLISKSKASAGKADENKKEPENSLIKMPSMLLILGFKKGYRAVGGLKTNPTEEELSCMLDSRPDATVLSDNSWTYLKMTVFSKRQGITYHTTRNYWNIVISARIIDGIETHVVDLLWSGTQSQCDECGKILTTRQFCCLSCPQYDCCLDCFREISQTRHDTQPGHEEHKFQTVVLGPGGEDIVGLHKMSRLEVAEERS